MFILALLTACLLPWTADTLYVDNTTQSQPKPSGAKPHPSCPDVEHDNCCSCVSDEMDDGKGDWDNSFCCATCTNVCNTAQGSDSSDYQGSNGSLYWGSDGSDYWGSDGNDYWGSNGSDYRSSDRSDYWGSNGSDYRGSDGNDYWGSNGSNYLGSDGSDHCGFNGSGYRGSGGWGSNGGDYRGSDGSDYRGSDGSVYQDSNGSGYRGSDGSDYRGSDGSVYWGSNGRGVVINASCESFQCDKAAGICINKSSNNTTNDTLCEAETCDAAEYCIKADFDENWDASKGVKLVAKDSLVIVVFVAATAQFM